MKLVLVRHGRPDEDYEVQPHDPHVARYRSTETLRAMGESEWRRFLDNPIAFFGGDAAAFRGDVLGALQSTIGGSAADARVAVFTHGLPINVVLSHALGLERIVHFAPGYASFTRLRVLGSGAIGVVSVNERGHQPFVTTDPHASPH